MGKRQDLSDFEKGLVGCFLCAVDSTYQKWSKEGEPVTGFSASQLAS